MLTNHVSCNYVVTSVTFYHSAVVDLTRSRSVHAVEHDPCCPDPTKLSASECRAVHYGLCSPLLKLPAFSVPPPSSSSPSSPATPKAVCSSSGTSSTPHSPVSPKGNSPILAELLGQASKSPSAGVGSPVFPKTPASPIIQSNPQAEMTTPTAVVTGPKVMNSPKMDIEMLDPVTLLASNLEDQLEALVTNFVAQDKVRLAARKNAGTTNGGGRVSSSASVSPIKKYEKKIVDDRTADQSVSPLSPSAIQNSKSLGNNQPLPEPDCIMQSLSAFNTQFNDNIQGRSSPSFKSSILPSLKPSPEYQQTGVKAQINKFTSKEKNYSSPSNSLERRQTPKLHPAVQETLAAASSQSKNNTLSLNTLQELLSKSPTPVQPHPIPTVVYQSSKMSPANNANIMESPYSLESIASYDGNAMLPYYVNAACNEQDIDGLPVTLMPSQTQISSSQSSGRPGQPFMQSAVDYAKNRMQNVQQGPLKDDKSKTVKNGHLVSDAKSKWENLPQQNWPESHLVTDLDPGLGDPLRETYQKGGHKRTMSMEGLIDVSSPSIPHPKLTSAQKQHIKERSLSPTDRHSHVPIRPFLTKGSVAERVLLFECCPDRALERTSSGNKIKSNLISTWRPGSTDVQNKTQFWEVVAEADKTANSTANGVPRPVGSLRRAIRRATSSGQREEIPRFYFPDGRPPTQAETEAHLKKVAAVFAGLNDAKATREEFGIITKACGLPLYWKFPLFLAARGDKKAAVSCDAFLDYWRRVVNTCYDEASRFICILTRGTRNYLVSEDFFPMMQDVIDSHPGLTFLKEATEFHSRYIHTVISRIFYCVNRSWSGKITAPELRKSNYLQVLSSLEEEEDINQITDYFSYEHFYVIYCKFWELDKDHDLYIDQNDLKLHGGTALSTKIIERIFSGAVTRGPKQREGKMSYTEFVWFLISEEDKRHPRSIEYWFRCMDLDGDGYLSMYELEYFYQEQLQRLDALGIETLPFTDCLCQMLDVIKPRERNKISLSDLKRCQMTPIFFDTFFNLEKYLDHEQRDPFASQRDHDGEGPAMSDWDRFAAEEYELLVAEEGANEPQDELIIEEYDEEIESRLFKASNLKNPKHMETEDDDYDYADSDDYHY